MTIRMLKEMIKDLPDDERLYLDNGSDVFEGDEVVDICCIASPQGEHRVLARTRNDFDTSVVIDGMLEYASEIENNVDERDFWSDVDELGYKPEDFENEQWAREQLENYGLL